MSAVAKVAVLHLRTVAPYRTQALLVLGLMTLILARTPAGLVPALALLLAPLVAVQPFVVADKSGLDTLYAVLPVPRRALVLGHYAWALASFLATAGTGTALALLLTRAEGTPFAGRTLATALTLSWALFALNIAIQLPLLLRYGYARTSVLGTTLPLALVMVAAVRLHLTLTALHAWLPLLWAAGAAVLLLSLTLATRISRR
ncbi:hypothetical protein CFP65_0905 [Kitasatospora sp. MMS16-BH015]|uniref:ABC-2 transporter permease n=1 Tax=Kitasatospora sp. MMS16-BH015 TaxID=2018025 RepID=UPI000CA21FC7|nr:ABC-2 transporter permease [Kitasatospora sp. MMS16-BH015]AUG75826.1 hypothetical protein CFP65_0905 [Kitasatospora sp. MMS16-BH015]